MDKQKKFKLLKRTSTVISIVTLILSIATVALLLKNMRADSSQQTIEGER